MGDFLGGLAGMFKDGMGSIGDLLGMGGTGGATPWTTNASMMNNPALQGGDMTQLLGRGIDGGGMGSLAGLMKDFGLKDLGEFGLGYMAMNDMKKNNKVERKLGNQQIAENDRITGGREHVAGLFNAAPSLAAGYVG